VSPVTSATVEGLAAPEPRQVEVPARVFARRLARSALGHKKLVGVILVMGVINAFFEKAPYVLLGPVIDKLTAARDAPVVPAGTLSPTEQLTEAMAALGAWLAGLVGASWSPPMAVIVASAVIAVVMSVVGAITLYYMLVLTRYFGAKMVVDLRDEVAAHVLKLPLRYFGLRRLGELISNVTTDTAVLLRSFTLAVDHAIMDPLLVAMNVAIIVWFVPQLTWVILLMVPLMALPLIRLGKNVRRRSSKSQRAMGDTTESLNQMLSGIRVVKAFQLEDVRLAEFKASNARFLQRTASTFRARGMAQGLTHFTYHVGFAVMIIALAVLVIGGAYRPSELTMIAIPLTTTYTHVKRLARAYNTLMESAGAYEGIEMVLREQADPSLNQVGRRVDRIAGRVEFQNVTFAYGSEVVVHDLSFVVEPGQTVALVGPSGGGKSTTLDLLARFHDPKSGRILIDGVPLTDLQVLDYRRHLAIVSQQPFLFNTTIYRNILLGRPGATEEQVVAAAKLAQIHDFVSTLPQGYETVVGERGANLSGGQMQRITIARAVLRDPRILILDEATSALDSESEKAVQEALAQLMRNRTSFVIAHRLSTIREADLILVMQAGQLVEQGRHEGLLARRGLYWRLTQLQQI
jgi:subfamily B ATP-binding cassette protein MsbA